MATRYVKFPKAKEAAAEALVAFIESNLPSGIGSWPRRFEESISTYSAGQLWPDSSGNWVVAWPYDGPFTYDGNVLPSPDGVEDLLTLGTIVDSVEWWSAPNE